MAGLSAYTWADKLSVYFWYIQLYTVHKYIITYKHQYLKCFIRHYKVSIDTILSFKTTFCWKNIGCKLMHTRIDAWINISICKQGQFWCLWGHMGSKWAYGTLRCSLNLCHDQRKINFWEFKCAFFSILIKSQLLFTVANIYT